jgi:hypothetical protein
MEPKCLHKKTQTSLVEESQHEETCLCCGMSRLIFVRYYSGAQRYESFNGKWCMRNVGGGWMF